MSDWRESFRHCPQGSSFGPLLRNIFQNDMTFLVISVRLSMYADDHQLYIMGNSVEYFEQLLNNGGQTISRWYGILKGNYDKYKVMLMNGRNNNHLSINVSIDGHTIKSTPDLKLLGVTLDEKLKYNKHISDICKLASKKVGVLVRLRKMIPRQAKLQLYKAAILPNLTYCHTVWHFCKASDARKLERVQERALCAVYDNKMAEYE